MTWFVWVRGGYLLLADVFVLFCSLLSEEAYAEVFDVVLQRSEQRVLQLLQHAHEHPAQVDDSLLQFADILEV